MGIGIVTGSSPLRLLNRIERNNDRLTQSLERLTTGRRINSAKDDPAGLIAAEQLRGAVLDLSAEYEALEAQSRAGSARESGLSNIQGVLHDLRGELVGSAGNLQSPEEQVAVQQSVDAAVDAVSRVSGGIEGGVDLSGLDALSQGGEADFQGGAVAEAVELVDAASASIARERASIGAEQRALDALQAVKQDAIVQHMEGLSLVEDTDFAAEASNFVASQTLNKAAFAVLALQNREAASQVAGLIDTMDEVR